VLTGAATLRDERVVDLDPVAVVLLSPALAVKAEECFHDGPRGPASHARREGAGSPGGAAPLLHPSRPEPHAQVLPGVHHGAVRQGPHPHLEFSPRLPGQLHLTSAGKGADVQVVYPARLGAGRLTPVPFVRLSVQRTVSMEHGRVGVLYGHVIRIVLSSQELAKDLYVQVRLLGVKLRVWWFNKVQDGQIVRRSRSEV